MDITNLVPEFNQYTLVQKKLFLDWIELPIENDRDEEARQRFLNSLNNPNDSNNQEDLNEIEINERLDLLIQRVENKETKTIQVLSFRSPGNRDTDRISDKTRLKERCKAQCVQDSNYSKCVNDCIG